MYKASTDRLLSNIEAHPNWPGFNDVFNHPPARLASRSPIWSSDMTPVNINAQWREVWTSATVVNQSLVPDPTIWQPGFDLPPHTWSMLNHFRQDTLKYCAFKQLVAYAQQRDGPVVSSKMRIFICL